MKIFLPLCFILLVLFSSCSSTPRRPAENLEQRNNAANLLNNANRAANQGRYDEAFIFLNEARRIALSTDDPALRIETSMSRANILFSMGHNDEAFREWEHAALEAELSGEDEMAALSRVYSIRASLTLLGNSDPVNLNEAQNHRNTLLTLNPAFRRNTHSQAALFVSLALAEKLLGNWTGAEEYARNALVIHERGNFLENAAYDWFLIASIRSLSGNYNTALEALQRSIEFDRRAENSFGLASSWQAMGDVYNKAGRRSEANAACQRAAEIFRAISLLERAERLEERINE